MIKKIFFFIFFLLYTTNVFPIKIILKNDQIIKGSLLEINNKNTILELNSKIIELDNNYIKYGINDINQKDYILYKKNKRLIEKIIILKITDSNIYYIYNENDLYKIINIDDLKYIKLSNSNDYIKKSVLKINNEFEINNDFNKMLYFLKDVNNSNNVMKDSEYSKLNLDDIDFYEKYWNLINNILSVKTKNLLWTLLETYIQKENYLQKILNNSTFDKKKIDMVLKLRQSFYTRARSIIYINEVFLYK